MPAPDHKAGLAVVVPTNEKSNQARAIVKQKGLSSPRRPISRSVNTMSDRQSQYPPAPPPPRYLNGYPSPHEPNGLTPTSQPNGAMAQRPSIEAGSQRLNGMGPQQGQAVALQQTNGVASHQLNTVVPSRPKLPGVEEALQYSPFSSIIPFSSDIIPIPDADLSGSQPIFPTVPQLSMARQPLEFLNEELRKTNGKSGVVHRVRHDLKPYLDPETITDFRFKPSKGLRKDSRRSVENNGGSVSVQAPSLGPFANMMLEATNFANRYPTPISPGETLPTSKPKSQKTPSGVPPQVQASPQFPCSGRVAPVSERDAQIKSKELPDTIRRQIQIDNDATFSRNGVQPAKSVHQYVPTTPQATPMVVIPPPSNKAYRNDYIAYEEPSSPKKENDTSKKRKREGDAALKLNLSQSRDQRAASDEILQQFQELCQDVFEAEDQAQMDSFGSLSSISSQFFVPAYHEQREMLTLSPVTHIKLESLLHKLINASRFGDVPLEHLQRLQRLCEGALTSADSASMEIDTEWDAEGIEAWVSRLDQVDAGLRSARTVLRIMTGGREEKQLCSEELLQNLLNLVKKVLNNCVVPTVEARPSGPTTIVFEGALTHKKVMSQLVLDTTKVMALLAKLLAKVEIAEAIVTGIEFAAIPLLFVDNAHIEKDSALGIQKFETLRRTAMDQISVIFSRYTEQRTFLLNEILGSLQKLPVNEKHARQYKLAEGKAIMLVSALIIQLIQISARTSIAARRKASRQRGPAVVRDGESGYGSSDEESLSSTTSHGQNSESKGVKNEAPGHKRSALQSLCEDANALLDKALQNAQYVVSFLVHRASNTAKSSESPHRQHLDIFVQDLITVLGSPEWSSAELLLRMVYASCRKIAENAKSSAPAKNMALELLGMMGSAISDLVSSTRHASKSLDNQDSEISRKLRQMLDDYLDGSLETSLLVSWDGPYHAVVEYLERNSMNDVKGSSGQFYYSAQWAKAASSGDWKEDQESEDLILKLSSLLSGAPRVVPDTLSTITTNQSRVAYGLTVLTTGFCRQSDYILKILLDSITSEQITVRTRSLKSVDKMLEGDPSVLDRARNVKVLISNCASDSSPMVRDSALTLIGKCINLRPTLEQDFLRLILRLTDDPAAGIRKRSMKMLKDIYLQTKDKNMKTVIGDALLQRAKDLDTGVADLSRQVLEDIWLSRLWSVPELSDASAQNKMDLRTQTSLLVGTARRGEKVAGMLVHLLKAVLSNNAKNAAGNFKVCKSLVATGFDIMIDNFEDAERLEQRHILQTLTVFAMANAKLFTCDQLQTLQPYINNLSGKDDIEVFRSIVIIFRCILPVQSDVQHGLLREIQKALLQSISKLGKAELNEVAECLWTINGTLQNPESLLRLMISVLRNLCNMRDKSFSELDQADDLKRTKKYVQIAGYFGKHCDFEPHLQAIQNSLSWWKGRSVAELMVNSIRPFTTHVQPLSLKVEAFDSIGLICQSWPYQFTNEHTSNTFQDVLRTGQPELQTIVLSSFRDFFSRIDRQAEAKLEEVLEGTNAPSGEKLGGSMTANEGDGASALIAQRFLRDILHIALASQDASALTATEVIASINRQGLVHPKESGPALVALETSTNTAIADVAFQEHRLLHQQHESMFEREYMRAIQQAFKYQKNIVGDTLGYTPRPYASKLGAMFDIIKTSKGKYQKKFLANFCSKIDFDIAKMDLSGSPPETLQFSRFLTENLAFFEYGRFDELLHTIACMERIVADTGSGIAHSISTEIFNVTIESMPEASVPGSSQDQGSVELSRPIVDPSRLRQLATASIILSSLWETRTFLRRLYGLAASQQKRDSKTKMAAKDLNKTPARNQGITGDKLVAAIAEKVSSLDNEDLMIQQCKDFVELLSVDSEVKVAAENEENSERPETPSGGDDEPDTPMSGRVNGMKRKGSVSIAGTPMKKKRGRPSLKRKKSGKSVDSEEDWD